MDSLKILEQNWDNRTPAQKADVKHAVKHRFSCPQSKYLLGELLAHFGPDVDYFLCAAGAHYDGELEGEIQELADRLVGPASNLTPDYDSAIVRSVLRAIPSPILGILSFNAIRWLCDKYQQKKQKDKEGDVILAVGPWVSFLTNTPERSLWHGSQVSWNKTTLTALNHRHALAKTSFNKLQHIWRSSLRTIHIMSRCVRLPFYFSCFIRCSTILLLQRLALPLSLPPNPFTSPSLTPIYPSARTSPRP